MLNSILQYGEEFRCREDGGMWVLEASVTESPGGLSVAERPTVRWVIFRRWKKQPSEARLTRGRAAALRHFNRTCIHCGRQCNHGFMHDKVTCFLCAGSVHGVYY